MNFLKKAVYVAVGVVIGVSAAVVPQAVASTGTKQATLTYKDIKVNINGTVTPLTDLEGREQEPFIAFDTVYVPLTAFARALGKVSQYNFTDNNIYITERSASNNSGYTQVDLYTLRPVKNDSAEHIAEGHDNTDSYLKNVISSGNLYYGSAGVLRYADYELNKQYAKLESRVAVGYEPNTGIQILMKIWGDGKLLYTSPVIEGKTKPFNISVDLNGISEMRIGFEKITDKGGNSFYIYLSDALLYKYK